MTWLLSKAYYSLSFIICSVLEKSPLGAKSDFEMWALKRFFLDQKKSPKEGLEVATPENLKWKKYMRESENDNGTHQEPLWAKEFKLTITKPCLKMCCIRFVVAF